MLFGFVIIVYILVCIILCFLVLIQSDKGGGISGAIGGGLSGANQLLGTQDTTNILTRGTTIFASAFMILCIIISFFLTRATGKKQASLLKKRAETQQSYSPASVLQGQGEALPIAPGEGGEGGEMPGGGGAAAAGGEQPAEMEPLEMHEEEQPVAPEQTE
ncbi:MAG: preprotein translocase subunit SecG [Chitinivibrionales bacterium]|nr:preprotein translocase subunit SecG [Chitinivibrionales bacterium]